jgi:hypothetical protein
MTTRVLVIIESTSLAEARELLKLPPFSQTAEQAAECFVPAGSATGDAPATHHWLSAEMSPDAWAACQQLCAGRPWAECHAYDFQAAPDFPRTKLSALGLQPLTPTPLP